MSPVRIERKFTPSGSRTAVRSEINLSADDSIEGPSLAEKYRSIDKGQVVMVATSFRDSQGNTHEASETLQRDPKTGILSRHFSHRINGEDLSPDDSEPFVTSGTSGVEMIKTRFIGK